MASDVHDLAARGISGVAGEMPHLDPIRRSFGRHDVSGIKVSMVIEKRRYLDH